MRSRNSDPMCGRKSALQSLSSSIRSHFNQGVTMKRTMILTVAILLGVSSAFAQTVRAILPVAGSAEGAFGSLFKTELQLNNRSTVEVSGTMVFHPIGRSASAGDPRLSYTLAPHQTLEYEDVVAALGTSGLGSIDF